MSLPSTAPAANPVNFEELLRRLDQEFTALAPHMIERFRFDINGMTHEVRRVIHENGFRFLISVTLGFLPFSIESTERREAIRSIIRAAQRLPTVRFSITPASKIIAGGVFNISHLASPDFVFYPLALFIQEARPFMDLIGKYIEKPVIMPIPAVPDAENG